MGIKLRNYIIHNQFLLTLFIIALGWIVYTLRDVFVIFFIAYIFAISFLPFVRQLQKRKWPKVLAIVTPYVLFLSVFLAVIIPLVPIFSDQISSLGKNFPSYMEQALVWLPVNLDASQVSSLISSQFGSIGKDIFTFTLSAFELLFYLFTSIVISIYLLIDYDFFKDSVVSLFSGKNNSKIAAIFSDVELKLGAWMRGQIVLSVIIGALCGIGYSIIGLPFAVPLALIAGTLEIFPTIGPVLGAIPALIVAVTISPTTFILVLLFYVFIHIVESNILVPKIMQKAVGIHPLVVILAVIVGGRLMGVAGALLSVPIISLLATVVTELREDRLI